MLRTTRCVLVEVLRSTSADSIVAVKTSVHAEFTEWR